MCALADDINDIFDNMGDYYEQKINKENHEDGEPIITHWHIAG